MTYSTSAQPQQLRPISTSDLRLPLSTPVFYKDVNLDWGGLSDRAGSVTVFDHAAIQQKMSNVLGVVEGEEPFEPGFGSRLPYQLFEPVNVDTAFEIEFDTIIALRKQMPAEITVFINGTSVEPLDEELSQAEGYDVQIAYMDNSSRTVDRYSYPAVRN